MALADNPHLLGRLAATRQTAHRWLCCSRDQLGTPEPLEPLEAWMNTMLADLRHAARMLLKNRGFTVASVTVKNGEVKP